MALSAGDKLGPYEVLAPLGAGGMGEVYKARDTRLDRSVAIKVLPEHIAKREDLRQRFEREARAVASLNHPHICVLHDIGSQDGTGYMVMEYLEGETLAARVARGALPLDQALPFAVQIADALDRAHRAGVTHRDVKPQNIMLTRDGVKVLDFGLAKSAPKTGPAEETLASALTTEGSILGTPQYMAPEQFEGKEADARSDIWAFGAVLYEMFTGQKAFQGKSYSSLVGAILSADPRPMSVKPFTPAALERLVRRCLAKDPEDRWQSMRDVVLDLQSIAATPAETPQTVPRRKWLWPAIAAVLALFAGATGWLLRPAAPLPVLTTSILAPDKAAFNEIAISPDGKLLAFSATSDGKKRQLWVRPLHSLVAQPLAGTEEARYPFWSPDSRWIGFFARQKLKKIEASGGPAQTLCDVVLPRGGGTWNQDGVILYSQLGPPVLFRVPAQGGTPRQITTLDLARGESIHRFPMFLPGGRQYLYLIMGSDPNVAGIYLGALDSKDRTRLVGDTSSAAYAAGPTGQGYLLFVREGTLMAQPLDAAKEKATGEAFPVAKVGINPFAASFSVSGDGMLVYDSSGAAGQNQLVWMDRGGKRLATVGEPGNVTFPFLSPDGKQVVVSTFDAQKQTSDLWLHDLARGIPTRFTFDPGGDLMAVWSPDGSHIVFASSREGVGNLYQKRASGAGQEELLLKSANNKGPTDWSSDGRFLLYSEEDPKTKRDLWVLPMEGDRKPVAVIKTEFNELNGAFSPDGRWIAYISDESGRYEIYAQPYPATGAKWQVSKSGGHWPRWRRDGKELFWLEFDGTMMAAGVSAGQTFQAGIAAPLFNSGITGTFERYSVGPDGQRFLLPMPVEERTGSSSVTVVLNWLAGAQR